jgi:hypothetical protein
VVDPGCNGITTDNENDESVVALVSYGNFRAAVGGDLSGFKENSYEDIESSVAPKWVRLTCTKFITTGRCRAHRSARRPLREPCRISQSRTQSESCRAR